MQAIAKQSIIAHNSISVTHKDYDSLWNYDELGENICLKCHSNYFYSQYTKTLIKIYCPNSRACINKHHSAPTFSNEHPKF